MKHALILAAGFGKRMLPLTRYTPKPLLMAGGKPLIVWHLERLAAVGITHVVINTSHLAAQFPDTLGDGTRWGLDIHYVYEGTTPLETGGGMLHALPILGGGPFLSINGDIWCDLDLSTLPEKPSGLAHLLLVDNPAHHVHGDFALDNSGILHLHRIPKLTYSGIGVFDPALLQTWHASMSVDKHAATSSPPTFKLVDLLHPAIHRGQISGQHYHGTWSDVGTPERLSSIDQYLRTKLHTS